MTSTTNSSGWCTIKALPWGNQHTKCSVPSMCPFSNMSCTFHGNGVTTPPRATDDECPPSLVTEEQSSLLLLLCWFEWLLWIRFLVEMGLFSGTNLESVDDKTEATAFDMVKFWCIFDFLCVNEATSSTLHKSMYTSSGWLIDMLGGPNYHSWLAGWLKSWHPTVYNVHRLPLATFQIPSHWKFDSYIVRQVKTDTLVGCEQNPEFCELGSRNSTTKVQGIVTSDAKLMPVLMSDIW